MILPKNKIGYLIGMNNKYSVYLFLCYPFIPLFLYMLIKTVEKFWSTGVFANIIWVFVTSMGVVIAAAMAPIKNMKLVQNNNRNCIAIDFLVTITWYRTTESNF